MVSPLTSPVAVLKVTAYTCDMHRTLYAFSCHTFLIATMVCSAATARLGFAKDERHIDNGSVVPKPRKGEKRQAPVDSPRRWLALYQSESRFELRQVSVTPDSDGDVRVDEKASPAPRNSELIGLYSGLTDARVGQVETSISKDNLRPGVSRTVSLKSGRKYTMKLVTDEDDDRGSLCQLVISSEGRSQSFRYWYVRQPDGPDTTIDWAGDIDGDGQLDFVLSTRGTNGFDSWLYTSRLYRRKIGPLFHETDAVAIPEGG